MFLKNFIELFSIVITNIPTNFLNTVMGFLQQAGCLLHSLFFYVFGKGFSIVVFSSSLTVQQLMKVIRTLIRLLYHVMEPCRSILPKETPQYP